MVADGCDCSGRVWVVEDRQQCVEDRVASPSLLAPVVLYPGPLRRIGIRLWLESLACDRGIWWDVEAERVASRLAVGPPLTQQIVVFAETGQIDWLDSVLLQEVFSEPLAQLPGQAESQRVLGARILGQPVIQDLFEKIVAIDDLSRIVEIVRRGRPEFIFLDDSLNSICRSVVMEEVIRGRRPRCDKFSVMVKLQNPIQC